MEINLLKNERRWKVNHQFPWWLFNNSNNHHDSTLVCTNLFDMLMSIVIVPFKMLFAAFLSHLAGFYAENGMKIKMRKCQPSHKGARSETNAEDRPYRVSLWPYYTEELTLICIKRAVLSLTEDTMFLCPSHYVRMVMSHMNEWN